jgi:hypothetical protein
MRVESSLELNRDSRELEETKFFEEYITQFNSE